MVDSDPETDAYRSRLGGRSEGLPARADLIAKEKPPRCALSAPPGQLILTGRIHSDENTPDQSDACTPTDMPALVRRCCLPSAEGNERTRLHILDAIAPISIEQAKGRKVFLQERLIQAGWSTT